MNTSVTSDAPEGEVPKTGGSTVWDALFMVFLVFMLAFVSWVWPELTTQAAQEKKFKEDKDDKVQATVLEVNATDVI